ncbi:MAG: hypothetical protein EPN22_12845 [Nitrospirae bacterium]|nr:MAG: hypothetical protein EPN22_12845 [Nitrospirota bacterium]
MKSDDWLLKKIVEESLTKKDIAHFRKLLSNGHSDDEVLGLIRERMVSNSKGMKYYIRQEKVRALTLKLSYRVHWTYILVVIKQWLREKEILIRWKEDRHGDKIDQKAHELKMELLAGGCKLKCNHMEDDSHEDVFMKLEKAAHDLLLHIEKETSNEIR